MALSRSAPVRQLTRLVLGIGEGTAPQEVARRDAALRRLLAMADILVAGSAMLVAVPLLGSDQLTLASLLVLPLVWLASRLMGLYDRDEIVLSKTTLNEAPKLFHLASLYALLMYIGQDFTVDGTLSGVQGLGLWGLFFVLSVVARSLVRRAGVVYAAPERCVIVGEPDDMARATDKLRHGWALNVEVVAQIRSSDLPSGAEARAALAAHVRTHDAHRVIVVNRDLANHDLLEIIRDMKAIGIKVSVQPGLMDVVGSAIEFEDIHGDVFLGLRRFGLTRAEWRTKRAMDLVVGSVLFVAAAPAFALIALAIKFDSPGPVFFRQERVGRDGRRFRIWKFRTMSVDAEARKAQLRDRNEAGGGLFKIADDPRVTRAGRLLRRSSLDELPQLLNVLRGEMSLVGPRPLVISEDERIEGWHRRRLHLTPGMTGMWQVLGSARIPLRDMVTLDYLYIVNWSIWRDLEILLRTVGFVLRGRGM